MTPRSSITPAFLGTPPPIRRHSNTPPPAPSMGGRSALELSLSSGLVNVAAALDAEPDSVLLPLQLKGGGHLPLLSMAMAQHCTTDVFDYLIAQGAQLEQPDSSGRTPLHYLLSKDVFEWSFPRRHLHHLHVQYAIRLIRAGALQPPRSARIGMDNHRCERCIRWYNEALAAKVVKRALGDIGILIGSFLFEEDA